MENWQTAAERNGITSRESSERTPSPFAEDEAAPTTHNETKSSKISTSVSSHFHAMLQENRAVPLTTLHNEGRNFTLEEILELGDDTLGMKVLLTAKQGTWLGVINFILTTCKKISLEKVSNPKTGKKKLGLQTFFFRDVLNIEVLGQDQEARQRLLKDIYFEKQKGKKLLRKKLLPLDLQEKFRNNIPQEEEVVPGLLQQLVYEEATTDKSLPAAAPPPPPPLNPRPAKIPRPSKWVIIDEMDEAYQKALCMISKEMVISLGVTGLGVGRSGTLVWLCVATSNVIFLFDVAKIGASEVMEGGLGMILQDHRVVKVIHDCRAFEDLLHHQLNLNLGNVFDTQAAEIYLYLLSHRGSVPLLVPSLSSLLTKYLSLDDHQLFSDGQKYSMIDDALWLERPLAEFLGERLAREVMYLREMRLEQLDRMLVDLRQITEVYLGAMRDKDSITVAQLDPQVVPAEVQKLGKQSTVSMKDGGIAFVQYSEAAPKPRLWRQ